MSTPALWEAIRRSRPDDVERLIDSGVSVLATDGRKNTAAHVAAEAGNLQILRLLSDRGAPIDQRNWIGQTPLSLAAREGHLDVVTYLCEHGAVTHGRDLNTAPLAAAAAAGHLEIVKYLVERRHVPLNSLERPFGATPLFVAARFLRLDVVRYLLEQGGDPGIASAQGETAISRATQRLHDQLDTPTPAEAKLCRDLLACLGGKGEKPRSAAPPAGEAKDTQSLLSHLIKPRKEWHFWQ